jgi:hypothetical protein
MLTPAQRMYDAWVTRDPGVPDEPVPLHCDNCGGFLTTAPDRTEPWEATEYCDAAMDEDYGATCGSWTAHEPHTFTVAGGTTEYRTCARCGEVNTWVEA